MQWQVLHGGIILTDHYRIFNKVKRLFCVYHPLSTVRSACDRVYAFAAHAVCAEIDAAVPYLHPQKQQQQPHFTFFMHNHGEEYL